MTEDEYETIRNASAEGGARCVSEFARHALLESARPAPPVPGNGGPTGCALLSDFDHRLTRVEKEPAQVADDLNAHVNETAVNGE
jgi:hypothetical protein